MFKEIPSHVKKQSISRTVFWREKMYQKDENSLYLINKITVEIQRPQRLGYLICGGPQMSVIRATPIAVAL